MAKPRSIGNMIAPWRFLVFVAAFAAAIFPAIAWLGSRPLGVLGAFDLAAVIFLILCVKLLRIDDPAIMEQIARENDANRTFLLVLTLMVIAVLLISVAAETVARHPEPLTKVLIIATLIIAWLFSNTVYALHYAHMGYVQPEAGCSGFRFPSTPAPAYSDFVYFAFACGMAFATSDVEITDRKIRKVVTWHCLSAFAFSIGVLAFTVNLLASSTG